MEPIAIIGFSFKFSGDATTAEEFWTILQEGRCTVSHVPPSRFNAAAFYHPDTNRLHTLPVTQGHFLKDDIAAFDAPFFSIKAAEAAAMDPQSRALLETTYRALENAGIPVEKCAGSQTCVYTGVSADDYRLMYVKDVDRPIRHAATGMAISMLANKISWFYDFKGPSIQLDTACSASLNALHLACQSIRSGESTLGVVGGANMFFTPESMAPLAHLNFFSPHARCHSFDHRANGYSRGEGIGVLILKPLSRAIAEGDPVRALIRATGSNENGRTAGGITKVNKVAQVDLIRQTYLKESLDFSSTRYVEAHGPGTEGDIVETSAFGEVFSKYRTREEPLYVGSVKANVGHLEGTSGIASLVKVILMLEKGIISRLANFEQLHPKIDADAWNLFFPMENVPWPPGIRRASINSFGFGGSNAHIVLEGTHENPITIPTELKLDCQELIGSLSTECNTTNTNECENGGVDFPKVYSPTAEMSEAKSNIFVWSAADKAGIERLANMYHSMLRERNCRKDLSSKDLENLAYTLALRRSRLVWRSFAIASSWDDLENLQSRLSVPIRSLHEPKIVFVFNGQGAQYARMGYGLLNNQIFRSSVERSQQALENLGFRWNIVEELVKFAPQSRCSHPSYSQPLCTALQIGLVDVLRSYGVRPCATLGHSSGEIAAAYATGVISIDTACGIAAYRGALAARISQENDQYGMMAVGVSESEARILLKEFRNSVSELNIEVGCINSPKNVTLTGDAHQLELLNQRLSGQSIFARKLKVNVPYHSAVMRTVSAEYEQLIRRFEVNTERDDEICMYSTVTAAKVSSETLCNARYWVQNLESPVLFEPALRRLVLEQKFNAFVEVGPHGVLRSAIKETLREFMTKNGSSQYISTLDRNKTATLALLECVGNLHCLGSPIKLDQVMGFTDKQLKCLNDLPEYPFDHSKTYWHESRYSKNHRFRKFARNDLLGSRGFDWNPSEAKWRNIIRTVENPWIEDHRIGGALIYPGAGMLVMAIEAANQYVADLDPRPIAGFTLKDITFLASLNISLLPEGTETEIFLKPGSEKLGRSAVPANFQFHIYFLENEQWTETCCGWISIEFNDDEKSLTPAQFERKHRDDTYLAAFQSRSRSCSVPLRNHKIYERFRNFGLDFGPSFQVFENVRYDPLGGIGTSQIRLDAWKIKSDSLQSSTHIIHPTALDGALQLPMVALGAGVGETVPTMVPSKIARVWVSGSGLGSDGQVESVTAVAKGEYRGLRGTLSEVLVVEPSKQEPKIILEGLETIIIKNKTDTAIQTGSQLAYRMDWKPDINMMTPEILQKYCQLHRRSDNLHHNSEANGSRNLASTTKIELLTYLDLLMHKTPTLKVLEVVPDSTEQVADLILWDLLHSDARRDDEWLDTFTIYDLGLKSDLVSEILQGTIESVAGDERVGIVSVLHNQEFTVKHRRDYDLAVIVVDDRLSATDVEAVLKLMSPESRLIFVTIQPQGSTLWAPLAEDLLTESMKKTLCLEVDLGLNGDVLNEGQYSFISFKFQQQSPDRNSSRQVLTALTIPSASEIAVDVIKVLQEELATGDWATNSQVFDEDLSMLETTEEVSQGSQNVVFHTMSSTVDARDCESVFTSLKTLIPRSKTILWINFSAFHEGSCSHGNNPPLSGLTTGLLRTIRNEYPDKLVVTLTLDINNIDEAVKAANIIVQVLKSMRVQNCEQEYHYREAGSMRLLHIPRICRSNAFTTELATKLTAPEPTTAPFESSAHPDLTLTITSPGLLDTLTFIPSKPIPRPLAADRIIIRPVYVGLNFLDLLTALGRIPQIDVLGVEAAGIVLEQGSSSDFKRGDCVVVLTDGTLRTNISAHYQTAFKIPDSLSLRDAASIPGTGCTVYRALVDIANLQVGESVLIHAGAGATGQIAIQLAQYLGAEVFVTVGSELKSELVQETYGIKAENIFFSRDASFVDSVKRRTDGKGVDVVLNSLAGGLLELGWEETVAPFGRWIELGKRDIIDGSKLAMRPFLPNVSFSCVDLSGIWRDRPAMMRRLLAKVFALVEQGHLKPASPIREFDVGDVEGAMRSLQNGKDGGKVVIHMKGEKEVKTLLPRTPDWFLRADRTYVISGGLGGLGRGTVRWMIRRGAKYFLLLSRNGVGSDPIKRAFVDELQRAGAEVATPKVDIANVTALRAVLQHYSKKWPLIAGCIQASMVLKDAHFSEMTLNDWVKSTSPKVQGSWNLHTLLPKGLDFFILFSSIVGLIGGPGQANYAAGNTFQDELARYRTSIGETAMSLDLGMITDEGAVAEDEKLARALHSSGWYRPVTMGEVEGLLEIFCNPSSSLRLTTRREGEQVICGLELPATIRAKGHREPNWIHHPMFRQLHVLDQDPQSAASHDGTVMENYKLAFETAGSLQAAGAMVTEAMVRKLSTSLGVPPGDIEQTRPIHFFGVDSLVALELRNWFAREIAADIAVFDLLGNSSCEAIGLLAAQRSAYRLESWA